MSTVLESNSEDYMVYENIELDNKINEINNDDENEINNDFDNEINNDFDKENKLIDKKIVSNVDILFEKLQKQFLDSNLILKTLHNNLKILHKEVLKERKELLKNYNKNKKKKKNKLSGFAVPSKITKKLADFLQVEEDTKISRTFVTKFICKYIKDNNLQNPENKKIIIPDKKFDILFEGQLGGQNKLEYFNIQTYLKEHFIK